MESKTSKIATEVPGFDELLGGGLPRRQSLILTGEPGTGKTVLCMQIAFAQAARGTRVLTATVTSESQEQLLQHMTGFSFFKREVIGEELFFVSLYSTLKKGPKEARDLLVNTIREREAGLLVVDGMRALRDLWRDESKVREFIHEVAVGLSSTGCVALFATEYHLAQLMEHPEATTTDGIVSLTRHDQGPASYRRIEVVKLRGQKHLTGRHTMRIDDRGVTVVPRTETVSRLDRNYSPTEERAEFGLAEFDTLMEGGLPQESTTLLAGSTGVGKTLLALHFAVAGAARGEKALFYAFREPPGQIAARAHRVGLDVQPLLEAGTLHIEYPPPVDADADELAQDILQKVKAGGYKRLVVDGLAEVEEAIDPRQRVRSFSAALIVRMRAAGVTAIFTKQVSKLVGPELDFSDTPIAAFAENLLFLRYVALRSKLHRVLSILNLRDSPFDSTIREFRITNEGLKVLAPFQSVEGLLTGLAHPVGASADTEEKK